MILLVAGTRPNFVKMAPVYHALARLGKEVAWVNTRQHRDADMSDVFIDELLPPADYTLPGGGSTPVQRIATIMEQIEWVLDDAEVVVVPGDVDCSLAVALAAAKHGTPVIHLESGLRSGDMTMPEELNRILIDRVSSVCLTHCLDACSHLMAEGIRPEEISLVGNTMIDSLMLMLDDIGVTDSSATNYVLVTLHRPALVDDDVKLREVMASLEILAKNKMVIFPVHPRTRKNLPKPHRVHLLDPLPYKDFLWYMTNAALVITDSGGVQEETSALGVPCLTYRNNTERPITCSLGTNRVVGMDPIKLLDSAVEWLAAPPPFRQIPLWDGKAGPRAADAIANYVEKGCLV